MLWVYSHLYLRLYQLRGRGVGFVFTFIQHLSGWSQRVLGTHNCPIPVRLWRFRDCVWTLWSLRRGEKVNEGFKHGKLWLKISTVEIISNFWNHAASAGFWSQSASESWNLGQVAKIKEWGQQVRNDRLIRPDKGPGSNTYYFSISLISKVAFQVVQFPIRDSIYNPSFETIRQRKGVLRI